MSRLSSRSFLTVIMDILVVIAVLQVARLVVVFFGRLASQGWAQLLVTITDPMTLPLGLSAIKTPYGGVFDVNAAATVVALLVVEWVLSIARSRG